MKCTETGNCASVCDRAHCLKIECAGGQKKWDELTAYAPNAQPNKERGRTIASLHIYDRIKKCIILCVKLRDKNSALLPKGRMRNSAKLQRKRDF